MPGYEQPEPAAGLRSSQDSQELRKRGNKYFLQATDAVDGQQHKLLELAVSLYRKALSTAAEPADYASAHKNTAAALTHLAQCIPPSSGSSSSSSGYGTMAWREPVSLLLQAVEHRCHAFKRGGAADMPEAWMDEAWDSLGCVVEELMELLSAEIAAAPASLPAALHQIDVLRTIVPGQMQSWVCQGVSQLLSSIKDTAAALIAPTGRHGARPAAAAAAAGEPDWRTCLMMLAESKRAIIEAIELAIDCEEDDTVDDLLHLEDDMWNMTCRCESAQARMQGDQMLQRVLATPRQPLGLLQQQQQQQQLLLDGVLSAIDLFKSAALLAKEKDLQAEAQAFSRLGHTYKVCADILNPTLKKDPLLARSAEERSRAAFLHVLGLVDSLLHRISLMMEPWYREARDAISEYQRTTAAEETARLEKERAPIREELRDELSSLYAAANKGWLELLKHCYTQHPPLNQANRVTDFSGFNVDSGKGVLRKAILAYHPDKQNGQGSSRKWQVLAEEITKALTQKYEVFK